MALVWQCTPWTLVSVIKPVIRPFHSQPLVSCRLDCHCTCPYDTQESSINPHLIKNFGNNTIRRVKSDPADSRKIVRYALDNRASLRQYSTMDTTRTQLKTLNSQMDFFTKQKVAARTNLISLLDMTYPGVNSLFSGPARWRQREMAWLCGSFLACGLRP